MSCWDKPKILEKWPEDVEYILSVDENGTPELEGIKRCLANGEEPPFDKRYFTATGIAMRRSDFPSFRKAITQLKYEYWPPEGNFIYKGKTKRVCFHSREIRLKTGPFSENVIQRDRFLDDLTNIITQTPFVIFSSTIDKVGHCRKYSDPWPVYSFSLDIIIERFCSFLASKNSTGILLLESRGKKEDKEIIEHLGNLKKYGSLLFDKDHFTRLEGAYFNRKWSQKSKRTYITLELADLVSYPIHKYCRDNQKDPAFVSFENKFYKYPSHYGCGLKRFP